MPDLLEEERADTHAAKLIDWKKLFPTNMSIDGSIQSFVQLLIVISAAAKDDTILMAFFASHGTMIPASASIYAASPTDAAINHAMRNVPTPSRNHSRDAVGEEPGARCCVEREDGRKAQAVWRVGGDTQPQVARVCVGKSHEPWRAVPQLHNV